MPAIICCAERPHARLPFLCGVCLRPGNIADHRRRSAAPGPSTQAGPAPLRAAGQYAAGLFSREDELPIYREPTGQTFTSIDTTIFATRRSPPSPTFWNTAPACRSSRATVRATSLFRFALFGRNGFGVRNIVLEEDGFSVTQPDGLSRTDLTDPHAYSGVDVYRGPSSALFGNYANGGAINFRTRTGAQIDGVEYGNEFGSYGYVNNYTAIGKKYGDFDIAAFISDVRGDGWTSTANTTHSPSISRRAIKSRQTISSPSGHSQRAVRQSGRARVAQPVSTTIRSNMVLATPNAGGTTLAGYISRSWCGQTRCHSTASPDRPSRSTATWRIPPQRPARYFRTALGA